MGQQRVVVVSAEPRSGDLASAAAAAQRMLDEIAHPPGVRSFVGGQILELGISLTDLVVYTSIFCATWAIIFYCIYVLFKQELINII